VRGFRKQLALTLALALAGMALAAAGCSGSVSAGSQGGTATYTNDQYGFSLTHDTQFTQGTPVAGGSAVGSSVFDIAFADTSGAKVGDRYVDVIQVSVYQLARAVKLGEIPKLKKEFQTLVDQMMGGLTDASVTEPLSLVEVNGTRGFKFGYTFTQDSVGIKALTHFLINGQTEYQVTGQASQENWTALSPSLQAAIDSFTVK
jgi:hypothetical protein